MNIKINLLLLIMLLTVTVGKAQSFNISGYVTSENMDPVTMWPVTIESEQNSWPYIYEVVFTDSTGHYQFTGMAGDTGVLHMTVSTPDCNQIPVDTNFNIAAGQSASADLIICSPVQGPCVAMFYYRAEGDTTLMDTFRFYNTSIGSYTQFLWDFGDGSTSSELSPVHTFSQGEWNVCLSINNDDSTCSDILCLTVVSGQNPCSNGFGTSISDLSVTFTGWTMSGGAAEYTWNFGDGNTGSGQNVIHTYASQGSYIVTLTTLDSNNCMAYSYETVTTGSAGCVAAYTWTTDTGNQSLIHFIDLSSGDIRTWEWDFGDGQFSAESSPDHLFQSGEWQVRLIIGGTTGCSDTCYHTITVNDTANCSAGFSWIPDPSDPFTVHFNDQSTGEIAFWNWMFGDGTSSTVQHPDHTFASAGTYEVCLTVSSADSTCRSTYCQQITVGNSVSFPVFGQVLANLFPADSIEVRLYKSTGGTLAFVDSAFVAESGAFAFYAVQQGTYILKADLKPTSSLYGEFLPTYSGNTILWENSVPIEVSQPVGAADIMLVTKPSLTTGTGFISGIVQTDDGMKNGANSGISGVTVYLFSMQNTLIQAVYTDEEGTFTFSDIPMGSYALRPEITGLSVTPYNLTIGENSVVAEGIIFTVKENSIQYGIDEILPDGVTSIGLPSPNPVRGEATIAIETTRDITIEITITDCSGRIVARSNTDLVAGFNRTTIPTGNLSPGMYSLLLGNSNAFTIRRIIVF